MAPGELRQRNAPDRRLPGLLHGAHAGSRPVRMTDDAAAAQIEEIDGAPGALIGLRRLPAPLARSRHRQRAVLGREQWRCNRLEGADERVVRLPIFRGDAVDLELVDAEQPPELLPNPEVHAEAGMAGEDVPAIAVRV